MQLKPFLTIGIPTWNRCDYLKKNILVLVAELQKHSLDNVEILVSDNASDDATESTVRELATVYPFITYHRHPTNLGANANFQQVITLASGEYVWLFGDDDLIADNCLPEVIKEIQKFKPDAVVGAAIYAETLEKATHRHFDEVVCLNREQFAKEEIIALAGKISGLIFKKSSVSPALVAAESVIKQTRTPWPHLAWLILLMNHSDSRLLVLPYGTNQLVGDNWHNLLFTGQSLLQIHFLDYQRLVVSLKLQLNKNFYCQLIDRSVSHRLSSSLKCVVYATYIDSYAALLKFAGTSYFSIVGMKNKLAYLLFIFFPLLLPCAVRKTIFNFASLLGYNKLTQTINRLQKAKTMINNDISSSRRAFNSEGL